MPSKPQNRDANQSIGKFAGEALTAAPVSKNSTPIWLIENSSALERLGVLSAAQRAWAQTQAFKPTSRKIVPLPTADGKLHGILSGVGPQPAQGRDDPMARPELQLGHLAATLPPGSYHLASKVSDPELAGVAWGLGAYRYRHYKAGENEPVPVLSIPTSANAAHINAIVGGVAFGRDLINTPANDMGPAEIEAAARVLAKQHGAKITSIVGDDLLGQNFPLIHAVGRASPRAPRLIDLTWAPRDSKADLPKITLVGKGIAFDTGGLDLKPSSGMLLMKKDMGGAAAVLALGHMIMAAGLPLRLRIIVAAAENSVAGNAFRPLDVIKSRAGPTVEIGNTDAEGRLVLADALALADEDKPDLLLTFATLTGAARVALGPDLPPVFTDDDDLAAKLAVAGLSTADPIWRLPMWTPYDVGLESPVADLNNVAEGGFAGAIVAALFLRRFVKNTKKYAHFDIYGWRPALKPLGPKGGEVNAARAVFRYLSQLTK